MARTVFYTTETEKQAALAAANAAGETMGHDDFNVGPNGEHRLTFAVKLPPVPDSTQMRLKALLAKVGDDTATLPEMRELMRIERGL